MRITSIGLAALFAACSGLAWAEDAALTEYVQVNVSALPASNTVATKLPLPLEVTPANVGVVTQLLLHEQDAVTLGDALYNVSGINVQAGPAVHDFFTIRGFDSLSSGLVLTDGAAEPEASFYPTYNIEGIEVLKGPGGFLYGANPLAGTVNMVRKQPLPENFAVLGVATASFGTHETTLDWNRASANGAQRFRLNGLWRESDGWRDDHDGRQAAANPSFTWTSPGGTKLNVNLEYVNVERQPDSGLPLWRPDPAGAPDRFEIPRVPRRRSYQSPVDFSDQTITRLQLDVERELRPGVKLRNKVYYRGLDWESAGTLFSVPPPFPGFETIAIRTLTVLDDRQEILGDQLEAIFEARTGRLTHNLLAGLELARYADEFDIDILPPQGSNPFDPSFGMPAIDIFDPQETYTGPAAGSDFLAGDSRSIVVAPYLVDQIKVSEAVRLLVGARYDRIDLEDHRRSISRKDGKLSPMAGAVWTPVQGLSLYANTGQSFAPASSRVSGDLEPERSNQVELGVRKKFLDGRLQATFAAYRIDRDNIAIPDSTGITQQAGDERSRGVELELAAEPLPRLRTFLSYAYNDAELTHFSQCNPSCFAPGFTFEDLSGNQAAYAPRNLLHLWISRSFAGGLGVAGGARYVGAQFFEEDNAFEVDDYLAFDAAVFYDREAWRFRLNLKNVTDAEYETGSFASTSVVPAEPFSVQGSAEYRF